PVQELIWTDCYTDKHCARLKVPLDYNSSASAAIALIRLPSAFPPDSPDYRGHILVNPGGPGGSGIDFVLTRGYLLSKILGPEFDIIGFDPRGIGRSTPRVSFFTTRAERQLWSGTGVTESLDASAESLPRAWARAILQNTLAAERDYDASLRFMNTEFTARDMLQIVKAHGRDKIQYWGFSYGTVLGATFAAMFPENVGRMVIDGVVDAESYYSTEYTSSLLDTDDVWQAFADACVAAGPSECAFYSPTSPEIMHKVDKIVSSLRSRPVPVPLRPGTKNPQTFGIADFSLLRNAMFKSLLAPYVRFPLLAQALADIASPSRDGTALLDMVAEEPFACDCDTKEPEEELELVWDASVAIACNDGNVISEDYADLETYYTDLRNISSFADQWAGRRIGCLGWPKFPKSQFRGPFNANTSFPLLVVGNTKDPVTPLRNAKKTSQRFKGSVVLTQDSVGHCSISGPSTCAQKHIRAYFLNGTLPPVGTICTVDAPIFPDSESDTRDSVEQRLQSVLRVD
ncbi:TAP-like protein-domain-containing protein, partial [Mycena amicta]